MRKNPSYKALLGPTHLLIVEKSANYIIKWSCMIILKVRIIKEAKNWPQNPKQVDEILYFPQNM